MDELADILSTHMLGGPYDPSSTQRERFIIDHLVEAMDGFALGDYEWSEIKAIFGAHKLGGFDLDSFAATLVEDGDFDAEDFQ
jgi:hypothetical protein